MEAKKEIFDFYKLRYWTEYERCVSYLSKNSHVLEIYHDHI